jgi:hypothetical protein
MQNKPFIYFVGGIDLIGSKANWVVHQVNLKLQTLFAEMSMFSL